MNSTLLIILRLKIRFIISLLSLELMGIWYAIFFLKKIIACQWLCFNAHVDLFVCFQKWKGQGAEYEQFEACARWSEFKRNDHSAGRNGNKEWKGASPSAWVTSHLLIGSHDEQRERTAGKTKWWRMCLNELYLSTPTLPTNFLQIWLFTIRLSSYPTLSYQSIQVM